MSTSCGERCDSRHSPARRRSPSAVARRKPHLLQPLLRMGAGAANRLSAHTPHLLCAHLLHWAWSGAGRRRVAVLRRRSPPPRHFEPRGPRRNGGVLVVPPFGPVSGLRLSYLARQPVSHMDAHSFCDALVL